MEEKVSVYARDLVPVIREVLDSGGSFDLTVTGTSMSPTLKPGRDQVRLVKDACSQTYPILFFQREDGTVVLHRNIKVNSGGSLVMNGDAQTWTETIEPSQIIGAVDSICRNGHWFGVDSLKYRIYVSLWTRIRFLRGWIFRLWRLIKHR